jgi:hypothetical protein
MPHAAIWFPEPEYTKEDIVRFMDRMALIALSHGFTTHGGPKSGRGNIRRLMEALVHGELVIESETSRAICGLERLKDLLEMARALGGNRACPMCYTPFTRNSHCPLHPQVPGLRVQEALNLLEEEVRALEMVLMDEVHPQMGP